MSHRRGTVTIVLLAAVVLTGGADVTAYAVNGHPILLGSTNTETRQTIVHSTGTGPALALKSRAKSPSLWVSSSRKVRRFNSDSVDGLDGYALRTRAWTYRVGGDVDEGVVVKTFPKLPPGEYLASYNYVAHLLADQTVSCYFTTPAQDKGVYGTATQTTFSGSQVPFDKLLVSVSSAGYVDTSHGIRFTCQSPAAFDSIADSRVTFTRLNANVVLPSQDEPAPGLAAQDAR